MAAEGETANGKVEKPMNEETCDLKKATTAEETSKETGNLKKAPAAEETSKETGNLKKAPAAEETSKETGDLKKPPAAEEIKVANKTSEATEEGKMEENGKDSESKKVATKDTSEATEPSEKDTASGEKEPAFENKESESTEKEEALDGQKKKEGSSEPSELETKIIKQIEYYFGDVNLTRDKFLKAEIKADNGWIPLEIMVKCNRLSQLSTDYEVILKALAKSKSELMELNVEEKKIRRSPDRPLPIQSKENEDALSRRTVYVKRFPLDWKLEALQEFFAPHGEIDSVRLRHNEDRSFKGSAFAVFTKEEDAKKFVTAESVLCGEKALEKRMLKSDYFKMKLEQRKKTKEESLKAREESHKQFEDGNKEKFKSSITLGAILIISKLPESLNLDDIRDVFNAYGQVQWVDYEENSHVAKVRFDTENGAKKAVEKAKEANDGKVMFKGTEIEVEVMEGEDELNHWHDIFNSMRHNQGNRGGRGRGRGGKRHYGNRDGGPHYKRSRNN